MCVSLHHLAVTQIEIYKQISIYRKHFNVNEYMHLPVFLSINVLYGSVCVSTHANAVKQECS